MLVIATKVGFYGGARRRIGSKFEFDMSTAKNGKLPSWMVEATAEAARDVARARAQEATRNADAAKAAAGPKRNRRGFALAPAVADAEDLV